MILEVDTRKLGKIFPLEFGPLLPFDSGREVVLGFDVTNVPGGASFLISKLPNETFRPRTLMIPKSLAPHFGLLDIQIGKRSVLRKKLTRGQFPCTVFGEDCVWVVPDSKGGVSWDVYFHFGVCPKNVPLTLAFQNLTGTSRSFCAVVLGQRGDGKDLKKAVMELLRPRAVLRDRRAARKSR